MKYRIDRTYFEATIEEVDDACAGKKDSYYFPTWKEAHEMLIRRASQHKRWIERKIKNICDMKDPS